MSKQHSVCPGQVYYKQNALGDSKSTPIISAKL